MNTKLRYVNEIHFSNLLHQHSEKNKHIKRRNYTFKVKLKF